MTHIPLEKLQAISDVDELKKHLVDLSMREAALWHENLRLRELYDRLPLGYQSLDKDSCFIEVNQSWLSYLGYTRQEVIGKYCGDFLPLEYCARCNRTKAR